jgi:hypothetical protein
LTPISPAERFQRFLLASRAAGYLSQKFQGHFASAKNARGFGARLVNGLFRIDEVCGTLVRAFRLDGFSDFELFSRTLRCCAVLSRRLGDNGKETAMVRINRSVAVVVMAMSLAFATSAFAAKKYQVTGTVVKLTDKVITVEKGSGSDKENWEIDRDSDTKVTGDLKVGAKVTIEYTMTASNVEVKGK